MKIKENSLITRENTYIEHEDEFKFGAPHHFKIKNSDSDEVIQEIHMQEGATKENGINGIYDPDLLVIVLTRLQGFQKTEFACRENTIAITKIEEAMLWLRKRTEDRRIENKLGTSEI